MKKRKTAIIIVTLFTYIIFFGLKSTDALGNNKELLKDAYKQVSSFHKPSITKAIKTYQDILKKNPKNIEALAGIAIAYSTLGIYNKKTKNNYENQFNKAYHYITKALELNDKSIPVKKALSYYYLHLSREKEARKIAREILSKHPKDPEALYILWASNGKNPNDKTIREVLKKNPNLVEARIDLAESLFHRKRRYSQAANEIKKAIKVKDSPLLRDLLGTVYLTQRSHDKAIKEFKKAISLDPTFASAYMNHGISLYYQNKINEGIKKLTKSISLNPRYPESYFYLARSYERKGNRLKSNYYYKKFISMAGGESKYYSMIKLAKKSLTRPTKKTN